MMKTKIFKMSMLIIFICPMLIGLTGISCEKDNGNNKALERDSLETVTQIKSQMNLIFSSENKCLQKFEADTVLHVFFSDEELKAIDNCNKMPEINFDQYTVIAGKIMVSSISDSISNIDLSPYPNSENTQYLLKITIHEPDGRYWAISYLYFWRLYPKLNPQSQITLITTKD